MYYNLWSTDNDKTDANDEVVIKSVYDPSPVGYSLPASNAFTGFTTTGQNAGDWKTPGNPDEFNVKFPFDNGWYFYTKPGKAGLTTFIPASGVRLCSNGNISYLSAINGFEWNADITGEKRGRTLFFLNNRIDSKSDDWKSWGHPVRSAEEKKWRCVVVSYNVLTSAALHPPHARRGSPPFMMSWMTQSHIATPTTHKKINALKFINSRNINR